MNIGWTLFGEMITFTFFVLFTMKLVWPRLILAMNKRQEIIANGLAASERGHKELEDARKKVLIQLEDVRKQSEEVLQEAKKQAAQIINDARKRGSEEQQKSVQKAESEIQQLLLEAREGLRAEFSSLALFGCEKVLGQSVNDAQSQAILNDIVEKL